VDLWGLSASDKANTKETGGAFRGIADFFVGGFNWITGNGYVHNNSNYDIVVKEEKNDKTNKAVYDLLHPGEKYNGAIDGILFANNDIYKGNGGAHIIVTDDGPKPTSATVMWDEIGNAVKGDLDYGFYSGDALPSDLQNWQREADTAYPGWR
jgi:hypothetical protein